MLMENGGIWVWLGAPKGIRPTSSSARGFIHEIMKGDRKEEGGREMSFPQG